MTTAQEYRDLISECLTWAYETPPQKTRKILFDIAKSWHRKIVKREHSLTIIDDKNVTIQPEMFQKNAAPLRERQEQPETHVGQGNGER
jgi:hypothetical protein